MRNNSKIIRNHSNQFKPIQNHSKPFKTHSQLFKNNQKPFRTIQHHSKQTKYIQNPFKNNWTPFKTIQKHIKTVQNNSKHQHTSKTLKRYLAFFWHNCLVCWLPFLLTIVPSTSPQRWNNIFSNNIELTSNSITINQITSKTHEIVSRWRHNIK